MHSQKRVAPIDIHLIGNCICDVSISKQAILQALPRVIHTTLTSWLSTATAFPEVPIKGFYLIKTSMFYLIVINYFSLTITACLVIISKWHNGDTQFYHPINEKTTRYHTAATPSQRARFYQSDIIDVMPNTFLNLICNILYINSMPWGIY